MTLSDLLYMDNEHFVKEPRSHACTIEVDGRTVSHVGWDNRTVRVDGKRIQVCAIGYVVTDELVRHRGFATTLMLLAHDLARSEGISFGALFTGVPGLYQPLGYEYQKNLSLVSTGGMVASLDGSVWPDGIVDPCGVPW
jgi:predicted acetyltransferase